MMGKDHQELARIELLKVGSVSGVRLTAKSEFLDMSPIERAMLLMAAMQLCVSGIGAIIDDYPDDADQIQEILDAVSILPVAEGRIN